MTLDQYVTRYRLLMRSIERDEKTLAMLERSACASFLRRFGDSQSAAMAPHLLTTQTIRERLKRRERLCLRYAERMARATALIHSPVIRQHAQYRYLFGMTQEDIARESYFALRTVYRHGAKAKDAMFRAMLAVEPRPARCAPGRFRADRPLPRRSYTVTGAERAAARYKSLGGPPLRECLI